MLCRNLHFQNCTLLKNRPQQPAETSPFWEQAAQTCRLKLFSYRTEQSSENWERLMASISTEKALTYDDRVSSFAVDAWEPRLFKGLSCIRRDFPWPAATPPRLASRLDFTDSIVPFIGSESFFHHTGK